MYPFLLCFGIPALAQDWTMRSGDSELTYGQLAELTSGKTLVFFDDGQSKFSVGGAYSYTYAGGATAFGRFDLDENGKVCVEFRNGRSRCDRYVLNAGRLILITQQGQRFPVREQLSK